MTDLALHAGAKMAEVAAEDAVEAAPAVPPFAAVGASFPQNPQEPY